MLFHTGTPHPEKTQLDFCNKIYAKQTGRHPAPVFRIRPLNKRPNGVKAAKGYFCSDTDLLQLSF
jgi:hypothetical protein